MSIVHLRQALSRRNPMVPRSRWFVLAAPLVALSSPAAASLWGPAGVPVCGQGCYASGHLIVPDGAGGVYVTWRDSRNYPVTDDDVYVQRITAAGEIAPGWPAEGLPVCLLPEPQAPTGLARDSQGGVIVVWYDHRNVQAGLSQDIYAQRVMPDGTIAPGWPENGAAVTNALEYQYPYTITPDGTGGAYVAWQEWRDYVTQGIDVYAQHLTAVGTVAAGWPVDGLPVCTAAGPQDPGTAVSDGEGGVVVAWDDLRSGMDTYAQRLLPDGTVAPGWTVDGTPVVIGRSKPRIAPDGAGGFYVGCSTVTVLADDDYFVQRFTFDGTRFAGWPENGVLVCDAPDERDGLRVAEDRFGGLLLAWYDYRVPSIGIYALRVLSDGSLAPGWTPNGVSISDEQNGQGVDVGVVPDGTGGAYVSWLWQDFALFHSHALVQRLTAQGAVGPGWPTYGAPAAVFSGDQTYPRLATDDAGGAIVVWQQGISLYAQRFSPDGPTPVLVSLAAVAAEPGRVLLTWQGPGASSLRATAYRRTEQSEWQSLGAATAEGPDRLRYEDHSVTAGERYAYRLGYFEDAEERFTSEVWVEVPQAYRFALAGARPHPVAGDFTVVFSLARSDRATLGL